MVEVSFLVPPNFLTKTKEIRPNSFRTVIESVKLIASRRIFCIGVVFDSV